MNFSNLRKLSRKIVRLTHVALVCLGVAYSPMASSVQITLGTNMKVRSSGDDGLTPVAVLKKGSVVEIPDQFIKRNRAGKIDAEASFNFWLSQAGYSKSQINKRVRDQKQDFYYPIRIVSVAGKPSSRLKGKTLFMALRVLERSSGSLRVKEDSPAYRGGSNLNPLKGLARTAPAARPARPARSAEMAAPAVAPAPAPEVAAPAPSAEPPVYTPPASNEDEADDSATEGSGDPAEDCPTCNLPANPVDDIARTAREQVDSADRISTRGLPGLSSQFPATCRDGRFIENDGSYGTLGAEILKQLRRNPDHFLKNGAAGRACPNFNSWVDSQGRPDEARRYHFWVYLMTAVFAKESTCRVAPPIHRGPDGMLCGLGQMPCDQRRNGNDNSAMRLSPTCTGDMSSAANNIRCSIGRLDYAVRDGDDPFVVRGNYWQVLRTEPRGMTKALISQYPDCGADSFSVPGSGRGRGRASTRSRTGKRVVAKHTARRGSRR